MGGRSVIELDRRPLPELPGHELVVLQFTFPPGFVGSPHTHTGTLVAFVVSGGFDVEVEGSPVRSYEAGQVYQELANRVMRLYTRAQRDTTRLIAFQVVPAGAAPVLPVLPPGMR
jgi:quercetin dioxygenase-like cupin family protein